MWHWRSALIAAVSLSLIPFLFESEGQAFTRSRQAKEEINSEIPANSSSFSASSPDSPWAKKAQYLFSEGEKAFQNSDYDQAIFHLKRLVERFPSAVGYAQAHFLLGKSFLKKNQPEKSEPYLEYFIEAVGHHPEGIEARLFLGEAFLKQKKLRETLLLAHDLSRILQSKKNDEFLARTLLIKAEALMDLDRFADAEFALSSALSLLEKKSVENSEHLARARHLELRRHLKKCSRYAADSPMKEEQVLTEMRQRSDCLLEATLNYRKVLQKNHAGFAQSSAELLQKAFDSYSERCKTPPLPPFASITEEQKEKYLMELSDRLKQSCQSNRLKALNLLRSWIDDSASPEETLPREMVSQVKEASKQLEQSN